MYRHLFSSPAIPGSVKCFGSVKHYPAEDVQCFTVDGKTKIMVSEASTLRNSPMQLVADRGLIIFNTKTKKNTRWVITATHRNNDNDVTHWTLRASKITCEEMPHLAEWKVKIFNT